MPALIDLVGEVFGRLTVIEREGSKQGEAAWRCRCECGNESVVRGSHLRERPGTRSCGCLGVDSIKTHGLSRTREYSSLRCAIRRCTDPRDVSWDRYGGRGIRVCQRWLDDPQTFVEDMGERPLETTLERLNVNGDYEPSNCVWATNADQHRNRRDNLNISIDGDSRCLKDWSETLGINYGTLKYRFHNGWSIKDMLRTPVPGGAR